MCKKIVLSAVAALLMAAANLNLCCSVLVNGREVPGFYSPTRADICEGTAYEAACELLPDTPELPLVQRHYSLRRRAPENDGAALTDAILRRIDGLGVYYAVFVNGDEMGLVEDDDRMKAMLRSNLYYQIPNSAIYASYHGEIDIRAVYAPDGMTTPYDDMVLLVRGRAPIRCVDAEGIARASLIDATPIGANVRSTVATYAGVHDELRRAFARTEEARAAGYRAGDFSYNTGRLRCPTCDGTGSISLDVQFLPDVDIECPSCRGSRYAAAAGEVHRACKDGSELTLPQLMAMSVDEALDACAGLRKVCTRLQTLSDLGLGYLTLGEPTPSLSGGEAQRLKLASEMGRAQDDAVFVFDEPTIGLHPRDVEVLLGVLGSLVDAGATVVVIEHDLDLIRNADYVIDMGPGGGAAGGSVVCAGTPAQVVACGGSVTGRYL